ncbi:MAG TPA: ribose-5-phosphate isomerase RpiA [Nannocystis sp.]
MSEAKRLAARRALEFIEDGMFVGVGTGSTVAHFITKLAQIKGRIAGAVASSRQTAERLQAHGIPVVELDAVGELPLYVDGADECDPHGCLIKGGGAALTGEKIVAEASRRFVCIIEPHKQVEVLGKYPLPIEVLPMALRLVMREITTLTGGVPLWRKEVVTDHGGYIIDVHNLQIADPVALEATLNQIPGVISVGLFARRRADVVIVGGAEPIEIAGARKRP